MKFIRQEIVHKEQKFDMDKLVGTLLKNNLSKLMDDFINNPEEYINSVFENSHETDAIMQFPENIDKIQGELAAYLRSIYNKLIKK